MKPESGESFAVNFDLVCVAIGRHVGFEGLQLVKAGVEVDEKGQLKLNEHLQTTNPDKWPSTWPTSCNRAGC